jgi:hypothetical protein
MSDRAREAVLGAVVVAGALGGLAYGAVANPIGPPVTSAATRFVERATFCPPSLDQAHSGSSVDVASAASSDVAVEFRGARSGHAVLHPRRILLRSSKERALDVVGYGAPLAAAATTTLRSKVGGAATTTCSLTGGRRWYFPAGTSAIGSSERLLVYNPFPQEAVVRVRFFTPSGERIASNLASVGVGIGRTIEIDVNRFVAPENVLSATVSAIRGRVVAWKAVTVRGKKHAHGLELSLGATAVERVWFLPGGAVGKGVGERLFVLNPNDKEAVVTVSLLTPRGTLQPRGLLRVRVPPRSSKSLSLSGAPRRTRSKVSSAGALVSASSAPGVVAERTESYVTRRVRGFASEIGAAGAATQWSLGASTPNARADVVWIMNPGPRRARVSVSLLQASAPPRQPSALSDVRVAPGSSVRLDLGRWTRGRPMVALVSSNAPVAAERSWYAPRSADIADVMGVPLTPTSP